MNNRTLDTRHPTVALLADQHTRILELEFENGLLISEVDRLRARLGLRHQQRCRVCGALFDQAGRGRPRLYCYGCRPIKNVRPPLT